MGHYELNGLSPEGFQSLSYFSSSEYDQIWLEAEQKTTALLGQIQPSRASEERRKAVINYVERLIEREFNCKVFPFGSVPLKTYLPDGDIDLTAISELRRFNNTTWATDVSSILEQEEHSHKSEFHVKEVKCIYAEVPVVKCLVENIIVDISFNQLGGLSTLCFLEEVDRKIGRDHLFKRSIILVKAWCFYESRILGAHHGLLSTYALEVLVLYIFHIFNDSLRGPLEVLFRFLQYFSKFDWNKYCLSLQGPIPLASTASLIGTMAVEPIQSPTGRFLLSEQYLISCREKFSTHTEESQGKTFCQKFMNLVDPLRPFNNLGRSVNKGNFVRIYSAFAYGAAQLEKLLQSPKDKFSEGLATFFRNTQGHCRAHRVDVSILGSGIHSSLCNCKMKNKDSREEANETCFDKLSVHSGKSSDSTVDGGNLDAKLCSIAVHSDADESGLACDGDSCLSSEEIRKNAGYSSIVSDVLLTEETSFHVGPMNCDNVYHNEKTETHLVDSPCRGYRFMDSANVDGEACKEEGLTPCHKDASQEEAQINELQMESSLHQDFTTHSQSCGVRDTDADVLEGDYLIHSQNLEAGRSYQNSHIHGNAPYAYNIYPPKNIPRGSVWEGPGRPIAMNLDHFPQTSSSRTGFPFSSHGVPPQDRYTLPNGMLVDGFPKYQKGTGTFFPNLKPNLEKDKHLLANGSRAPRRGASGMDFPSTNFNANSAFRPRSNLPKKREGVNKLRPRKATDVKVGEQDWDLLTEDSILGNVLPSPTSNTIDNFSNSFQRQFDIGASDTNATLIDSPISSPIVPPSSNSKELPLEELEFGSFGPGFLARGLPDVPANKDNPRSLLQTPHNSFSGDSSEVTETGPFLEGQKQATNVNSVESSEEIKKSTHNGDRIQSYQLKEEDFPPLAFGSQRESPNTLTAQKNTAAARRSYHEACVIGNPM